MTRLQKYTSAHDDAFSARDVGGNCKFKRTADLSSLHIMADHDELKRGIINCVELAKSHGHAEVELPLGWYIEAEAAELPESVEENRSPSSSIDGGVVFMVTLPDGSQITTWKALSRHLQDAHKAPAALVVADSPAPVQNEDEGGRRRGGRNRTRPLEFWAGERRVYKAGGELDGVIMKDR